MSEDKDKPQAAHGVEAPTDDSSPFGRTPETFHFHRKTMHDTIWVQEHHDYVNDGEEHEKNPHLQDFLVPHHSVHVESPTKPILERPCQSILHKVGCPSRHACEITENNRHIGFDKVIVRDYAMILGDHPNCRYGPPVTIEWDYTEYEPLDVNEYEIHHSLRRPLQQMYLTTEKRKSLLVQAARHDQKEVNLAARKVKQAQTKALKSLVRKLKRFATKQK